MSSAAVETLLRELEAAERSDRLLDAKLAAVFGYRRIRSASEEETGKPRWVAPTGEEVTMIPFYTTSIDEALTLLQWGVASEDWGVSWEEGIASAQIASEPPCQASTPALALCMAAVNRYVALAAAAP